MSVTAETAARNCVFSVIDFETTGSVAGWPVEPWQVGIVQMENGCVSKRGFYSSLLHVGDRPFNHRAPGRHAQLRDALKLAPAPRDIWPELEGLLCGRALVAHNIGTERSVLNVIAPMHRFGPWVDTLSLTRRFYPSIESKTLESVIGTLGLSGRLNALCPGRCAHDALYDAFACAVLLEHFLALPGWERVTLGALL